MTAEPKPSSLAWPWPMTFPFPSLAPQQLNQPIGSGWIFANTVSVTEQNSSAPDTERRIVAEQSYGRQIGRLMDAVSELIKAQGGVDRPAFTELEALRAEVEAIKTAAAKDRLDQIRSDLDRLKVSDPAAYDRQVAELKRLISP
jgi:hypothetical protein